MILWVGWHPTKAPAAKPFDMAFNVGVWGIAAQILPLLLLSDYIAKYVVVQYHVVLLITSVQTTEWSKKVIPQF